MNNVRLDERKSRIQSFQNSLTPIERVRLQVKLPQFTGFNETIQQKSNYLISLNYESKIHELKDLPSIDKCLEYDTFSEDLKRKYATQQEE